MEIFKNVIKSVLVLLVSAVLGCATHEVRSSSEQQVAQFPFMSVGDSYDYVADNKEYNLKVVEVKDDGTFVMAMRTGKKRDTQILNFSKSFLITDEEGKDLFHFTKVLRDVSLEFPMSTGKSWVHSTTISGWNRQLDVLYYYKVKKFETITVKAGSFDAFRIDVELKFQNWPEIDRSAVFWYSPEAKAIIKSHYNYSNPYSMELISHTAAVPGTSMSAELKKMNILGQDIGRNRKQTELVISDSDIEKDVPLGKKKNHNAVAVIIGNRDYLKTSDVDFAVNDALTMHKYLTRTLGYKQGNIFLVRNALKSDFELYFGVRGNHRGKLYNTVKEGKSDVFVYYSGHGAPGLNDKKGYFVPVEADPHYIELGGYSLDVFYENISRISARSVTVVVDSCFSGVNIFKNISPVALEISNPVIAMKNGVVLSSSTGSQVSSWYNDKKHGMFTYFFLKAIHNKNADINMDKKLTIEEIYNYVSDRTEGVPYYARRIHGVEQEPIIEGGNRNSVLVEYK